MWVRGLKQADNVKCSWGISVAPHVGAWIETYENLKLQHYYLSHPMWVRGLKP